MNPSTAIILHPHVPMHEPANSRSCIENDGPAFDLLDQVRVHLRKGTHLDFFVNEARTDFPYRDQRAPRQANAWTLEQRSIRRCIALLEDAEAVDHHGDEVTTRYLLDAKHRRELLWRLRRDHPLCDYAEYEF